MGRITFTEQDIKRNTLLEPGWYLCEITELTETEEPKDKSTTYIIEFKVVSDNPEINGVPMRRWFNEKFRNYMMPFIECFTGGKVAAGKSYEITRDLVGKQININVGRGDYKGKPTNNADDFAPVGAPVR